MKKSTAIIIAVLVLSFLFVKSMKFNEEDGTLELVKNSVNRIPYNGRDIEYHCDGQYVVFSAKNLHNNEDDTNIYVYNIKTKGFDSIIKNNANQKNPLISDERIFFEDDRFVGTGKNARYFLYDIHSEKETEIGIDEYAYFIEFVGNDIFYVSYNDNNYKQYFNIFSLDNNTHIKNELNLSEIFGISDAERIKLMESHRSFEIFEFSDSTFDGENVVFIRNKTDFMMYSIEKNNVTSLFKLPSYVTAKDVSFDNNKIVWSDNRNGRDNFNIYFYDLYRMEEREITLFDDTGESEPSISGNNIIYVRKDDDYYKLYLYDLNTGENKEIFDSKLKISEPKIKGNLITWKGFLSSWSVDQETIYFTNVD